jgi:hypothetical protein
MKEPEAIEKRLVAGNIIGEPVSTKLPEEMDNFLAMIRLVLVPVSVKLPEEIAIDTFGEKITSLFIKLTS